MPRVGHLYVKRTGTKGHYKYTYADGRQDSSDKGKLEHVKRLIAGRTAGLHDKSNAEIVRMTGLQATGASTASHRVNTQAQLQARRGHAFDTHHLHEAKHEDTASAAYQAKTARAETSPPATRERAAATVSKPRRKRATRRPTLAATTNPATSIDQLTKDKKEKIRKLRAKLSELEGGFTLPGTGTEHLEPVVAPTLVEPVVAPTLVEPAKPSKSSLEARRSFQSLSLPGVDESGSMEVVGDTDNQYFVRQFRAYQYFESRPGEEDDDDPDFTGEAEALRDVKDRLSRVTLASYNVDVENAGEKSWIIVTLTPKRAAPAVQRVGRPRAATQARAASARATSRAVSALAEVEPMVAVTEAPITRMAEVEAAGGNPYLSRAKEIFERIKSDVADGRKGSTKYMLQAFATNPSNKSELKEAYRSASGLGNFSDATKDFEAAVFVDVKEILDNKPLDLEVERMKRGYPAMQYERLKPYIKDSWHAEHPSGYPPMPTWGDLKSWGDHGSARPASMSWTTPTGKAGGVTQAMPQEVFDAAVKIGGRPQFPPASLPINLMPAWNYVVKKAGASAYIGGAVALAEGKIVEPTQGQLHSYLKNSLRRYVQMRGGPEQLVDIPSHKMQEAGITHRDIFKAMSSAQLEELIKTKIIDMVELVPFIDAELGLKKSYSLVVDITEPNFKRSKLSEETMRKSLIREIRRLRNEKEYSYMSRV